MARPRGVPPVEDLLVRLVRIPSTSGLEEDVRDRLAKVLAAAGAEPRIHGRNLWAVRGAGDPGDPDDPVLVLNSHYDTVRASEGWTRAPWAATREGERIYGLGANDAKGSVAALTVAFLAAPEPARGRLVLALVCDEETGGQGLEALAPDLPTFHAAVVGEPTGNLPCPGQRGLVRLVLHAWGRAGHASRPEEGVNAIEIACRDLQAVMALDWPGEDSLLGRLTLQATRIQGGVAGNVIPPSCDTTLDIRTIPDWPNEQVVERIQSAVQAEVEVRSMRYLPLRSPEDSPLPAAARQAAGGWGTFRGVSDLYHLRAVPGVVLGPGASNRSHAPDEYVEVGELRRAVEVYGATIQGYFERMSASAASASRTQRKPRSSER